jgi:hypothetical protein
MFSFQIMIEGLIKKKKVLSTTTVAELCCFLEFFFYFNGVCWRSLAMNFVQVTVELGKATDA